MPNRIIYESICTSDNIDALTWFDEVFFTRLIVNADDFGRMDGRPAILKARLFPLKTVQLEDVESALQHLEEQNLIQRYKVNGKPYLQLNTWDDHQRIRAKISKYPGPEEANTDDGHLSADCVHLSASCGHLSADCGQAQTNDSRLRTSAPVIQSESNPNPNPNPTRARARGEVMQKRFDEFWRNYPKHEGKGAALKAWNKINPSAELLSKMLQTIEKYKKTDQWNKDGGQYIPLPATWLNQGRWDDDPPEGKLVMAKAVDAVKFDQREYDDADFEKLYVNLG